MLKHAKPILAALFKSLPRNGKAYAEIPPEEMILVADALGEITSHEFNARYSPVSKADEFVVTNSSHINKQYFYLDLVR